MDAAAGGAAGAGPPGAGAPEPGRRGGWTGRRGPGGGRRRAAELRAGLRPVVQAEHGEHDAGQFGGDLQRAFTVAVLDRVLPDARVRRAYQAQRGPEGRGQGRDRAPHHDPARARVGAGDLKAVPGQHGRDELQVGRVGAVLLGELLRGQGGRDLRPGPGAPAPGAGSPASPRSAGIHRPGPAPAIAAADRARCRAKARRTVRSSFAPRVADAVPAASMSCHRVAGEPFPRQNGWQAHQGGKCGGRERPQPFPPSAGCLVGQAARD